MLSNDPIRILSVLITSCIHHFFLIRNFKILSSRYFVIYNTLLLTIVTLLCKEHYNLFFLYNCDFITVNQSISILPSPLLPHCLVTTILLYFSINIFFFKIPHMSEIMRYLLSVSGLFHLTLYPTGSSMLLQLAEFHSFFMAE